MIRKAFTKAGLYVEVGDAHPDFPGFVRIHAPGVLLGVTTMARETDLVFEPTDLLDEGHL